MSAAEQVERLTPLEALIAFAADEAAEAAAEASVAAETVRVLVRHGWELPGWALAGDVAKQYAFGLRYGYPVCCVEAFCRDLIDGESPVRCAGGPSGSTTATTFPAPSAWPSSRSGCRSRPARASA